MHWSDFDPYLRPESLGDGPRTFEITGVAVKEFGTNGHTTHRPVLSFKETDKGLVLSLSQSRVLATRFGDNVDACIGQRVTLQAVPVQVNGAEHYRLDLTPVAGVSPSTSDAYEQVLAYARQVGKTPWAARNALRLAEGDPHIARAFLEEE